MDQPPPIMVQVISLLSRQAQDAIHQAEWAALMRSDHNATVDELTEVSKRGINKANQIVAEVGKSYLPIGQHNLDAFGLELTLTVLKEVNRILPT